MQLATMNTFADGWQQHIYDQSRRQFPGKAYFLYSTELSLQPLKHPFCWAVAADGNIQSAADGCWCLV